MRLRFRDQKPPSRLERRFLLYWQSLGGPELKREFRFHLERKWRADFAHVESRTLLEIEGGLYIQGRHNRPQGFAADAEKYPRSIREVSGSGAGRLARPPADGASDHRTDDRADVQVYGGRDDSNLDAAARRALLHLTMGLGTKNRLTQNAALCREHLRTAHPDKLALVNEFIAEIQGSEGDARWNQFTDLKRTRDATARRRGLSQVAQSVRCG